MNGTDARFVKELAATLDRTERHILMLRYVEELTPIEIAAVLELSEQAVIDTLAAMRRRTAQAIGAMRRVE